MLPIHQVSEQITKILTEQNQLILQAPPGAGKSTCLPLILLNHFKAFSHFKKIIMLEPRRVAARNIAEFLAMQLKQKVGQSIGLRMRGESRVGPGCKLEIVTEGVMTRILQQDPELSDYSLLIFDEFHERSLHSDLAFVLAHQIQSEFRDDLKLLLMSATLDLATLERILPDCPVVKSEGRQFPIEVLYRPVKNTSVRVEQHLLSVLKEAMQKTGDILMFFAGIAEINRFKRLLEGQQLDIKVDVLHGQLALKQQKELLSLHAGNSRRVILATNIAETSLTIPSIKIVIDSGIHKKAVFDAESEFSYLQSERISQASAQQRAGRAGRTAAGTCYRIWPQEEQNRLKKAYPAEIESANFTPVLFEALLWGEQDMSQLNWPTPPSAKQIDNAYTKLKQLQLAKSDGLLNAHGRQVAGFNTLFFAANILNISQKIFDSITDTAAILAAYLAENGGSQDWDLTQQLQLHLPQLTTIARKYRPSLQQPEVNAEQLFVLLSALWPNRIAKLEKTEQDFFVYKAAYGSALNLKASGILNPPDWIIIVEATHSKTQKNANIRVCLPFVWSQCETYIQADIIEAVNAEIHKDNLKFIRVQKLGKLIVSRQVLDKKPNTEQQAQAWLQIFVDKGLLFFNQAQAMQALIARINLAAQFNSDFHPLDETVVLQTAETWLLPYLHTINNLKQLKNIDLAQTYLQQLDYARQQWLQTHLPAKWLLNDGRQVKIDYLHSSAPLISGFMQSFYGCTSHPSLLNGRLPLTVELLSPAKRAIQTTADLSQFWQGSYKLVQKDMKARYPKHYWPDAPETATAGTQTKKNRSAT
ncbi:ATP-dependent helicase HrpB [Catenovulum sediminis]|uniref:ATP-dependent helicase HrpB n=1 Tax=Catenovulum sediminis TaxID=1740262 RepID=A0ABV1RHJ9_9ALTE